jgi:hypothetical protein
VWSLLVRVVAEIRSKMAHRRIETMRGGSRRPRRNAHARMFHGESSARGKVESASENYAVPIYTHKVPARQEISHPHVCTKR